MGGRPAPHTRPVGMQTLLMVDSGVRNCEASQSRGLFKFQTSRQIIDFGRIRASPTCNTNTLAMAIARH